HSARRADLARSAGALQQWRLSPARHRSGYRRRDQRAGARRSVLGLWQGSRGGRRRDERARPLLPAAAAFRRRTGYRSCRRALIRQPPHPYVPRTVCGEIGMPEPARVALLVTCLVDLFRPTVGFAAVKLLEQAGCTVEVPAQTCCGQPAYNSGDKADAKAIARQVIAAFAGYDYVVAPSGSCAGMVKVHYPEMFADEPATLAQAQELASRT